MRPVAKKEFTQETIRCRCGKCGYTWLASLLLPMPLVIATKVLAGIAANGCPHCGARQRDVLVDLRSAST